MNDSPSRAQAVSRDRRPRTDVTPDTSDFDYAYFEARTSELGARTDEDRARLAGISLSTLIRLKRGKANPTLKRISLIALNLDVERTRLIRTPA